MLKLPRVGKNFNGWQADPLPPKKEISNRKKKSHKKHKLFLLGNYGWPTCQLQIITGIYCWNT